MRCGDLMSRPIHVCRQDDTAAHCAQTMREHGVGFVPVVDEDARLVGVVTDRDLALRVLADSGPPTTPVREVMTRPIVSCAPDEDLRTAEQRMVNARVSRIVVMTAFERCEGVISLSDIARAEGDERAGRMLREVAAREASPPPTLR